MAETNNIEFDKYIDIDIPLKDISVVLNTIINYLAEDRKDTLTCDTRITEDNLYNRYSSIEIKACCLASYMLNEIKDYYNYYPVNKNFKKDILTSSVNYYNIGDNLELDNNKKEICIIFKENSDENNIVLKFVVKLIPRRYIKNNKYIYSYEYDINYITLFSKIINNAYILMQKEIANINKIRNLSDYMPVSNDIVKKTCCYYIQGNPYNKIQCTCKTVCLECSSVIGSFYKKNLTIMYDTVGNDNYKNYSDDIFNNFIKTLSNIPRSIIHHQYEKITEKCTKKIPLD